MESFKLIKYITIAARSIDVVIMSRFRHICLCVCVWTILEIKNDPKNEEVLKNSDALKSENNPKYEKDPKIGKKFQKRVRQH